MRCGCCRAARAGSLSRMWQYSAAATAHALMPSQDWAEPFMAARGFRGVFRAKPDPPLPSAGGLADGTAVFYRTAAFSLLAERSVNFTDQAGTRFNQVAVLLTLRHEAAGGEVRRMAAPPLRAAHHLTYRASPAAHHLQLVVAGTHLKAKAAGAAARSEQVKQLAAMVREQAGERAVVVCGDMNEEPGACVCLAAPRSGCRLTPPARFGRPDGLSGADGRVAAAAEARLAVCGTRPPCLRSHAHHAPQRLRVAERRGATADDVEMARRLYATVACACCPVSHALAHACNALDARQRKPSA